MFDLSFGKLAIIFTLCLIVLGPEKLPKLAAQLGRWTGQARAMARHFREQLEQEIATEELLKQKHEFEKVVAASIKDATDPVHDATQTVENVIHPTAPLQAAASEGEFWEDSHLSSGHVDLGQPASDPPVANSHSSGSHDSGPDSAATQSAIASTNAAAIAHGGAESQPKSTDV